MNGETLEKDIYKISFPRNLSDDDASELRTKIKSWLLESAKLFVFDFSDTFQISKPCLVEILKLAKTLKQNEKFVASLNISSMISSELKTAGVLSGLSPFSSLDEAKKAAGFAVEKPAPKANAEFIGVFIDSAKKALEVQASTKVTGHKKPYVRKPDEILEGIAIAGVINLASTQFNGSISLCFPKTTFLAIYKNMMDEDCTEIDNDSIDAAGELLNIMYGQAKTVLVNEKGYDLSPAIPNVLVGEQLKIQYHTKAPVMVLAFNTEAGDFHIEIVIDGKASSKSAA